MKPGAHRQARGTVGVRQFAPAALLAGALALPAALPAAPPPPDKLPEVLRQRCAGCHGPSSPKGALDLTSLAALLRGGAAGPAAVPGRPDDSRLFQMVRDGRMPPRGAGKRLTEAEIGELRRWIQELRPPARQVTQHDIIPLMHLRCAPCHGGRRREGGLDVRTRAAMLRGGKSGPAMTPGRPAESLLLRKIESGEMPPPRLVVDASVKPMEPDEVERLRQWIAAGAPEADPPPVRIAVAEKDRSFWAFRAPRAAAPPRVSGAPTPVDAFLLLDLRRAGLEFEPEADRATLIRRVTYDLTGLPPTPEEAAAFARDTAPGAYERLVDRLLASPRYGEKWARGWLDLAGYSDSEGIQDADPIRPDAYRYRDYVIRSLNADKPYDRFLLEQLAGDELADVESAREVTPELADNLIATSFLTLGPDGTFSNITSFVPDRLDVIADSLTVLSSSVMGLTLRCARCHDHKTDPLSQRDYYALSAIFRGALDEHDWLRPRADNPPVDLAGLRLLPHVPTAELRAWEAAQKSLDEQVARVKAELAGQLGARVRVTGQTEDVVRKSDAGYQAAARAAEQHIQQIEAGRRPRPLIRAVWDRGEPTPAYVLRRGDYRQPAEPVEPAIPAVLADPAAPYSPQPPWPGARKTGRRLAFARWLTRPEHPLTGRVLVNRVWKQHFGAGIVRSVENFGRTGVPPTHPDLLDWLAVQFTRPASGGGMGWSLKSLHRLLVTSRAYRQRSSVPAVKQERDPGNRLLSRFPLRRLEAEELYDSLLFVSGRLDETPFGPADALEVRPDGLVEVKATGRGWRRAVYALQRRKQPITLLESFDLPPMGPNCTTRPVSTVAPQALYLMNNGRVRGFSHALASRAAAGQSPREQAREAHSRALGRAPTAAELARAEQDLARLQERWTAVGDADPARRALESYCHVLLNSAAFLYVD